MSGASESVSRMPRRISAWSSQRTTLFMAAAARWRVGAGSSQVTPLAGVVVVHGVAACRYISDPQWIQGDRQNHRRPPRAAAELDPAAHGAGTLVQAADA